MTDKPPPQPGRMVPAVDVLEKALSERERLEPMAFADLKRLSLRRAMALGCDEAVMRSLLGL